MARLRKSSRFRPDRNRSNTRAGSLDENGFHDAEDTSLLRRVRPTIEGKFNDIYGFKLTTDFGNGISGSSHLVDAYIDANYDPAYKIRVGKFTPGLSLYRLQSSSDTKLNELTTLLIYNSRK